MKSIVGTLENDVFSRYKIYFGDFQRVKPSTLRE